MKQILKGVLKNIIHFEWTVSLLKWIILVTGTMSECAFLIASIYICLNSGVHNLLLAIMPESMTVRLSELSTAIFIALPECIVFLAVVKTISHFRSWRQTKEKVCFVWFVLFGLPTVTFAVLTVVTIGESVLQVGFLLPPYMVVIRALSAYFFAFVALLYQQIGIPMEVNRLQEKDRLIDEYGSQISELQDQNKEISSSLKEKNLAIEKLNAELCNLQNENIETRKLASVAISQDNFSWLLSQKSVCIEEAISRFGVSKNRIMTAIKNGNLQLTTRNKDRIVAASLHEWLEEKPNLRVVNE